MDAFTALQERRSIRKYSTAPVEEEKLQRILEAAQLAPSAGNAQNWKFIVVTDQKIIEKLKYAFGGQEFVTQAPVIIVACGTEPTQIMLCGQYRYTVDLSIALSYLILEAQELKLGTCWLGRFEENKVKDILNIPEGVRVVAVTPLGYPVEIPPAKPRKQLSEIVSYQQYT